MLICVRISDSLLKNTVCSDIPS